MDRNVSVVWVLWKKNNIKQMCSIVDLLTFLYTSLLYLFKYIQVIPLIWEGNTQLVKRKVTYLAINVETAQSSVIKSIAVPIFNQTDKHTSLYIKVYVKHLIKLENNVNVWIYAVKCIQHFLCNVSVADFADTVIWRLN